MNRQTTGCQVSGPDVRWEPDVQTDAGQKRSGVGKTSDKKVERRGMKPKISEENGPRVHRGAGAMPATFPAALTVAAVVAGLTTVAVVTTGCQIVAAFAAGFLLDLLCLGLFLLRVFASGIPTGIRMVRS